MTPNHLPSMLKDETGYDTENNVNLETGWREVSRGLGQIVLGNLLSIGAIIAFIWVLAALGDIGRLTRSSRPDWRLIVLYLSIAGFGLSMLTSYWMVLVGQWKCLYAPERRWAKTLMFSSMLCTISAPALNFLAGFVGGAESVMIVKGAASVKYVPLSMYMQLAAALLNMAGGVYFILFLRAVANCFDRQLTMIAADLYLIFCGILIAGTLYLLYGLTEGAVDARDFARVQKGDLGGGWMALLAVGLGFGWLGSFIWYLWLVLGARRAIEIGTSLPRRPITPTPSYSGSIG